MYLGTTAQEVEDNLKPLFPPAPDDQIIVATRKHLWLVTLRRARYLKHHVLRVTPDDINHGLGTIKSDQLWTRVRTLKERNVL